MVTKKEFFNLIQESGEEPNKIELTIWHESCGSNNIIYGEIILKNEDNYFMPTDNYDLYYTNELEETEDNLKILIKESKKVKTKINLWLKGTYLQGIEILINEENV